MTDYDEGGKEGGRRRIAARPHTVCLVFFEDAVDEAHENVDTRRPERTDTQEYFGNWLPLIVHYRHTHSHFTAIFLLITTAHGRPCPPFLCLFFGKALWF